MAVAASQMVTIDGNTWTEITDASAELVVISFVSVNDGSWWLDGSAPSATEEGHPLKFGDTLVFPTGTFTHKIYCRSASAKEVHITITGKV